MAAALLLLPGCDRKSATATEATTSPPAIESDRTIDPRLREADGAIRRKEYPIAIRLIAEAQKEGVPESDALRMRADVFRATDYIDLEIETLREWVKADPGSAEPLLRLFYIYLDLGWRWDAGNASANALKVDPDNYRASVARAIHFYRSAEPELGLPFIEIARRARPRDPDIANLHASILLKRLRYSEAEGVAREALTLDSKNLSNRLALAHALVRQNKAPEANAELAEVLRLDPENVEALFESGALAQKRGDSRAAVAYFEKAAAKDVQFGNIAYRLGTLYLKEGKAAEGRRLLEMFRKMEATTSAYETVQSRLNARRESADFHFQLARYHLEAEEYPHAVVELKQALKLAPRYPQARRDLIHALMRQGRTTEARRLLAAPTADTSELTGRNAGQRFRQTIPMSRVEKTK